MTVIEVVTDLDARWCGIAPLLLALHEHHAPPLGKPLLDDWEPGSARTYSSLRERG